MSIAAVLGRLIGNMADPLVWVPVLLIVIFMRQKQWPTRVGFTLATSLVISLIFAAAITHLSADAKFSIIVYRLFGALVWLGIFDGARSLIKRRQHG